MRIILDRNDQERIWMEADFACKALVNLMGECIKRNITVDIPALRESHRTMLEFREKFKKGNQNLVDG